LDVTEKRCTKCGETKAVALFPKNGRGKDGVQRYRPHCGTCRAEEQARYADANRERLRAYHKAHYTQIRDEKTKYRRNRYAEDPDAYIKAARAYRQSAQGRAARAAYLARNGDRQRENSRRRRARKASATVEPFTPADMYADWADHDLWQCFFCAGPLEPLNVEHFHPLSPADENAAPGPHALWNLVPACATCNLSKSNKEPWSVLREHLAEQGVDLDEAMKHLRVDYVDGPDEA
jgi:5-methylcytosine-specific restriction endonuclease McrA